MKSSIFRFQNVLYASEELLSGFWNFYKLKREDLISWGEIIPQRGLIIWSPLLYFNFKSLNDLNSLSFIRFQCVLHRSEELLSGFWNFYKLKRGNEIFWGNQFCKKYELFSPPFSISILKSLQWWWLRGRQTTLSRDQNRCSTDSSFHWLKSQEWRKNDVLSAGRYFGIRHNSQA